MGSLSSTLTRVLIHVDEVLLELRVVLHEVVPHLATHTVALVLLEEPSDFARGQDRVHVLAEALALDLPDGSAVCQKQARSRPSPQCMTLGTEIRKRESR